MMSLSFLRDPHFRSRSLFVLFLWNVARASNSNTPQCVFCEKVERMRLFPGDGYTCLDCMNPTVTVQLENVTPKESDKFILLNAQGTEITDPFVFNRREGQQTKMSDEFNVPQYVNSINFEKESKKIQWRAGVDTSKDKRVNVLKENFGTFTILKYSSTLKKKKNMVSGNYELSLQDYLYNPAGTEGEASGEEEEQRMFLLKCSSHVCQPYLGSSKSWVVASEEKPTYCTGCNADDDVDSPFSVTEMICPRCARPLDNIKEVERLSENMWSGPCEAGIDDCPAPLVARRRLTASEILESRRVMGRLSDLEKRLSEDAMRKL